MRQTTACFIEQCRRVLQETNYTLDQEMLNGISQYISELPDQPEVSPERQAQWAWLGFEGIAPRELARYFRYYGARQQVEAQLRQINTLALQVAQSATPISDNLYGTLLADFQNAILPFLNNSEYGDWLADVNRQFLTALRFAKGLSKEMSFAMIERLKSME